MTLWEKIAALSSEVIKEQGLASIDKAMDADLFRFLHYLQEKAEQERLMKHPPETAHPAGNLRDKPSSTPAKTSAGVGVRVPETDPHPSV